MSATYGHHSRSKKRDLMHEASGELKEMKKEILTMKLAPIQEQREMNM
jgi:hypothetical protein